MENYSLVRIAARDLRTSIDPELTELNAGTIVAKALTKRGLTLEELPATDSTLAGGLGVYNRKYSLVAVSLGLAPEIRLEVIAHEIGHDVVHQADVSTVSIDYGMPGPGDPVLRVEAYGIKERREAQANVFARELLLPRVLARRLFLEGTRAQEMATKTGLSLTLVYQQLTDALLLPEPPPPDEPIAASFKGLDHSQEHAANHRGSAFLLEAGPGTGKTRTLVERIVRLIERGDAKPDEILALTFSNKAAGELIDRVGKSVGAAAANIWTSTFHAFGLELLRRHHDMFGLSQDPRLVDGSQAIDMLEEVLPALPIIYNQNLFEPALALRDILKAIARAKDELVDWKRYGELADAMAATADDDDERLAAAKAQEVALVYRHYQERLEGLRAVDYGDLVMLPALRLHVDEAFRNNIRQQFRWIHVDEYQDINRASAVLIKGIAGDGKQLWVVGDARQSIYRFRGASTRNMARFGEDYPFHRRAPLSVNYRSTPEIIGTFTQFSRDMKVSAYSLPLELEPDRKANGEKPGLLVADDSDDEYSRLAGSIRQLEADGCRLKDQAILARSNATLGKIGEELESRNVAVRYLGPLFDRPEVRDLLSLLALVSSSGSSIMRVGTFPEYAVDLDDLLQLLDAAENLEQRAVSMLSRLDEVKGLSARGLIALRLLASHVQTFDPGTTPWLLLMEYLFERSDYMSTLLKGETPSAEMRRVAVRQLIEALRSMPLTGNHPPIARGLKRIRHMVLLADERDLRKLPDELSDVDGVHLLTVHASKGLEFEAIHLPGLRRGAVPAANRPDRCPPPVGLVVNPVEDDAHSAEEECLFFVAMSRARSVLRLYRPASANGRNANPATYLDRLTLSALSQPVRHRTVPRPTFRPLVLPRPPTLTARDFEVYERCPRRFYYDRVVGLSGERLESAYLAAHRCLLQVMEAARSTLNPLANDAIDKIFEDAWRNSGLIDHVFEQPYRQLTETMLTTLRPILARGLGTPEPIVVKLDQFEIEVRPDQLVVDGEKTTLRTIRSGRPTTSETDRLSNSLLLQAAAQAHGPGAEVETFHIATGETTMVSQTPTKKNNRLATSAEIAAKIAQGNFPPAPSDWDCPRCKHFFLCPAPAAERHP